MSRVSKLIIITIAMLHNASFRPGHAAEVCAPHLPAAPANAVQPDGAVSRGYVTAPRAPNNVRALSSEEIVNRLTNKASAKMGNAKIDTTEVDALRCQ
jgi:hypothetical protein